MKILRNKLITVASHKWSSDILLSAGLVQDPLAFFSLEKNGSFFKAFNGRVEIELFEM